MYVMTTMTDVARNAGVSTATVSRVLNNPVLVDPKTRNAVLNVISKLDYQPNAVAQGLVNKSSKTIGVVINQFSSSYYGRMLDGIEHALSNLGFKTIAESSMESMHGELNAVTSLLARQCEGVVLHSDNLSDQQITELLDRYPQIVLMNRLLEGYENRCVYLDNVRGGAQAAEYLAKSGHQHVAVVTGPKNYFECQDRLSGFLSGAANYGFVVDSKMVIEGNFTSLSGRVALEKLWAQPSRPTAIFFMNDEMAAGALDVCLERGITVPNDVSIMGFDDLRLAEFLHPKLTTIRQPLREIGEAAGLLAHAIATKGDSSNHKQIFEAEVIERASVRNITT